jgi:hypothetical protein
MHDVGTLASRRHLDAPKHGATRLYKLGRGGCGVDEGVTTRVDRVGRRDLIIDCRIILHAPCWFDWVIP